MVLEYEESMEDFYAFALFCHQNISVFKMKILFLKIIVPAAYLLIISYLSFFAKEIPMPFLLMGWLLGIAAALGLWKFFIPRVIKRDVKKLFNKILQEQKHQLTLGRRTIEFSPDGLTLKTSRNERHLEWAAVEDIVSTKEHIFIIIGAAKAYIIPKRIFSDEEGIIEFTQTIKGFQKAQ